VSGRIFNAACSKVLAQQFQAPRQGSLKGWVSRTQVFPDLVLLGTVEEDEKVSLADQQQVKDSSRTLRRGGLGLEQAGARGESPTSDGRRQTNLRRTEQRAPVGGGDLPPEFALPDALGDEQCHGSALLRLPLRPKGTDLIHLPLVRGVHSHLRHADSGGFQFEGDTPGPHHLAEEKSHRRRHIEPDLLQDGLGFRAKIFI
jgi:hypothetical protein